MRALALVLSVLVGTTMSAAVAQPQIPATVYGSVTIAGKPAPSGIEVRAFVGAVDCTQAGPGQRLTFRDGDATAYVVTVVHESQRQGCGREGTTITFTIDGRPALQSVAWTPGPIRLDLSLESPTTIPLPTPTLTPTIVPNIPPTGPPPTDDVALPGLQPPGSGTARSDEPPAGAGAPLWPWFLAALALAASAGVAAVVLPRRRRSRA